MIKSFLQLSKRPFVRNVATVASGTAASQAIAMAFSPIITRLYGPEAYGLQSVFMTVAGLMTTIAALSYPIAIVLPKSDIDALAVAKLSLIVGVALTIVIAVILLPFGSDILSLLNAESISSLLFLIPIAMILSIISDVVRQWLIRKRAFLLIAKVGVLTTFTMSTIKTGLGFLYPSAIVLVVANMISGALSVALTFWGAPRSKVRIAPQVESVSAAPSSWSLLKRYSDFALYRTPQNLINGFSHALPVILLATYSGPTAVGLYSIAAMVLAMPARLIGGSVMQVFYPRINEAMHQGENARKLIIKATAGLALMGALPFLVIIVAGPWLFSFVFGTEWEKAGVYAQWLAVWLFFQFINRPSVSAIPAFHLQRGLLVYETFSAGAKVLGLYLGFVYFANDVFAVALFSVFGAIAYIWLILWVIRYSGNLQYLDNSKE